MKHEILCLLRQDTRVEIRFHGEQRKYVAMVTGFIQKCGIPLLLVVSEGEYRQTFVSQDRYELIRVITKEKGDG